MVATRSSKSAVASDENRMIVCVTGANSGFGLGICQRLLSDLSLPPGYPIPAATPQTSALPPSKRDEALDPSSSTTTSSSSSPHTLTLILACRSQRKAEEARTILLDGHDKEVAAREARGAPVRAGWREGLRIVWEGVDLDAVEGSNGCISFCQRLKDKYPHLTTLFLNAGLATYKGNDFLRFAWQVLTQGLIRPITIGTFSSEYAGVLSEDGKRGKVWGVNVLASYILAKELAPLLRLSPASLPFPPRIVYTSSVTATLSELKPNPLDDYQLLTYGEDWSSSAYRASKYCGDLVMLQLDKQFAKQSEAGERPVRVLIGDPGCVMTNIAVATFGSFSLVISLLQFFQTLTFWVARFIGSPHHPIYAVEGAWPMVYAALIGDQYIEPADRVPAQKFTIRSRRFKGPLVDFGEVDRWEESLDIGEDMARACDAIRVTSRRSEGLE